MKAVPETHSSQLDGQIEMAQPHMPGTQLPQPIRKIPRNPKKADLILFMRRNSVWRIDAGNALRKESGSPKLSAPPSAFGSPVDEP